MQSVTNWAPLLVVMTNIFLYSLQHVKKLALFSTIPSDQGCHVNDVKVTYNSDITRISVRAGSEWNPELWFFSALCSSTRGPEPGFFGFADVFFDVNWVTMLGWTTGSSLLSISISGRFGGDVKVLGTCLVVVWWCAPAINGGYFQIVKDKDKWFYGAL